MPGAPPFCTLDDILAAAPAGSKTLDDYLSAVYGPAADKEDAASRAVQWNWKAADIVWLCHLPLPLRQRCRWPTSPQGIDSLYIQGDDTSRPQGWLWRYTHASYCHCCKMAVSDAFRDLSCHPDMGGERRMADPHRINTRIDERGFWIEVTHAFIRSFQPFERDALWFYRAQGSGTWFFTGRTLLAEDTVDLARLLNRSLVDGYAKVNDQWHLGNGRVGAPITKSEVLQKVRALGFDSVILSHHLDPEMHKYVRRAFYKVRGQQFKRCPSCIPFAAGFRHRPVHLACLSHAALFNITPLYPLSSLPLRPPPISPISPSPLCCGRLR